MADAVARREARRRRILENSHNRLQLISGKSTNEVLREPSTNTTIISKPEYEVPATSSSSSYKSLHPNGVVNVVPELFEYASPTQTNFAHGDGETTYESNDMSPLVCPPALTQEPASTLSSWEKIIAYKYDIALLSLFIQCLYGMSIISFDSGYFFLPVLVYVITKLIWFPTKSNSNLANMLMLLQGMSSPRVQKIIYLSQIFGVIAGETFVYLFVTICTQALWLSLTESLVT